jgi:hypothetical protein
MDTIPPEYLTLAEHLEELEAAWIAYCQEDAARHASTKKKVQYDKE